MSERMLSVSFAKQLPAQGSEGSVWAGYELTTILLLFPPSVAGSEVTTGAQPGTLLQRIAAQRQPDRKRRSRVSGNPSLKQANIFLAVSSLMVLLFCSDWQEGFSPGCHRTQIQSFIGAQFMEIDTQCTEIDT